MLVQCILSIRRMANVSSDHQKYLRTIFQSLVHVTDGKISTESMAELVVRFEIEKGDMQPPARRRWRDRFLKLDKLLPTGLKPIATRLADAAFKLPQGQSFPIPYWTPSITARVLISRRYNTCHQEQDSSGVEARDGHRRQQAKYFRAASKARSNAGRFGDATMATRRRTPADTRPEHRNPMSTATFRLQSNRTM